MTAMSTGGAHVLQEAAAARESRVGGATRGRGRGASRPLRRVNRESAARPRGTRRVSYQGANRESPPGRVRRRGDGRCRRSLPLSM